MPSENDVNVSATNEFGGDTDWGEAPVESTPEDRGDVIPEDVTPEVESTTVTDQVTEDETDDNEPDDVDTDSDDDDVGSDTDTVDDDDSSDDEVEEDESDDDSEDDSDQKPTENRVPLHRLNKEINARKELERKLKEIEAKLESQPQAPKEEKEQAKPSISAEDFSAMSEAMLDGDNEKAMELFSKMVAESNRIVLEEAKNLSKDAAEEVVSSKSETERIEAKAAELSQRYPEIDANSEFADQGIMDEVVSLSESIFYSNENISMPEAMEKAVKFVALEYQLQDRSASKPEAPAKPKLKKKDPQIKKKIEVADKEKGRLEGSSRKETSKVVDIDDLTDEQFASLSKEALAELRGDMA